MILKTLFLASLLIQQTNTSEAPTTNSGETFVDPFAEEQSETQDQLDEESSVEPTFPEETDPNGVDSSEDSEEEFEIEAEAAPAEEDFETEEMEAAEEPASTPSQRLEERPEPVFPSEEPLAPQPVISPQDSNNPFGSESPPVEEEEEELKSPSQSFEFPEVDEPEGPTSQAVVEREMYTQSKTEVGDWHMGGNLGFAANLNKRASQIHSELYGGYRLWDDFDLGFLISLRMRSDVLLGFYATSRYYWRMTDPEKMRIDLVPMAGLGWTLKEINGKFREGRMSLRFGVDGHFYIAKPLALTAGLAIDTHVFAIDTDGATINLFKSQGGSSGPPSQLLLLAGLRYDF